MVNSFASSNFGSGGNSSSGRPRILKKLWPQRIEATFFAVDFDLDFAGGQFAHDVDEAPRRQRGRACLLNLRLDGTADADIEVGRGEANLAAVRLQEDVRKNRQRRACADHVLDGLQTFEELLFADAKFHEGTELGLDE